jgi:hypothetical protein
MLKAIGLAVALTSILGPNSSALADARSAAEFVLKICLPAMACSLNADNVRCALWMLFLRPAPC